MEMKNFLKNPDTQAHPALFSCRLCGGELYTEDYFMYLDGKIICLDCLRAFTQAWLRSNCMTAEELIWGRGRP